MDLSDWINVVIWYNLQLIIRGNIYWSIRAQIGSVPVLILTVQLLPSCGLAGLWCGWSPAWFMSLSLPQTHSVMHHRHAAQEVGPRHDVIISVSGCSMMPVSQTRAAQTHKVIKETAHKTNSHDNSRSRVCCWWCYVIRCTLACSVTMSRCH